MNLYKGNNGFLLGLLNENNDNLNKIKANTVDASIEKHVPIVSFNGNEVTVRVGSILHPMVEEHYIQMIIIQTTKGYQIRYLNPGEEPIAKFFLVDEFFITAYEYCNLHGLWKSN